MLLGVALIAGCQFSVGKKVESGEVEQRISEQLGPQLGGTPKSVTCPDDLKGEKGATLSCTMVTANGTEVPVVVTVTSVKGNTVNFDMRAQQ